MTSPATTASLSIKTLSCSHAVTVTSLEGMKVLGKISQPGVRASAVGSRTLQAV